MCPLCIVVMADMTTATNEWATNWRAAVALIVGFVPNLPGLAAAVNPKVHIGGAQYVYDIFYLYGFIVTFVLYYILNRLFPDDGTVIPAAIMRKPLSSTGKRQSTTAFTTRARAPPFTFRRMVPRCRLGKYAQKKRYLLDSVIVLYYLVKPRKPETPNTMHHCYRNVVSCSLSVPCQPKHMFDPPLTHVNYLCSIPQRAQQPMLIL